MKISDFNISGKPIPEDVADKIEQYHLHPLRMVDACMPVKVWPSAKSGYRPRWWELEHGRDGNSQHCFKGMGATDVTCENFQENKDELLKVLIEETQYTRICEYNTFYLLDYAMSDERWLFKSIKGKWLMQYQIDD